ncbi:MAG: hypothetical protein R3B96_16100 [Pirellulaceae bacterium]
MAFEYGWLDLPQHELIAASRMPSDLEPLITACGIDATVFVQTQHDLAENRWVLQLADTNPLLPVLSVGWIFNHPVSKSSSRSF